MPITVDMEFLMRYRPFIYVLLFVFCAATVAAQSAIDAETDVFAPFVSRLRVAIRDPQIRVTWRDSADLDGGRYRIYRHTTEITQDSFGEAQEIAIVDPGVETYLDTPLEEGTYYYAVLAENEEGNLYEIFVPFRNKTIRGMAITNLETEEDLAAAIYDIEAQVQDNAVVVRFDASRNGRRLSVYRSTLPIVGIDGLAQGSLIDEFESSTRRFADYPVPGVDYYYAVFDAALIERGTAEIRPGENVLAEPIRISLDDNREITIDVPQSTTRPAPLPILQLAGGVTGTRTAVMSEVPRSGSAVPVSAATREAIDVLLAQSSGVPRFDPDPVILPEERLTDMEGASATLAQIVSSEFSRGDWSESASLLENLLQLPLEPEFERRVRFYRGQALYFDMRRESAFLEFLSASEGSLYAEVRPWVDGILSGR